MTVNELSKFCTEAINEGLGEKDIMIPADEEGNDWHRLLYAFTTKTDDIAKILEIANVRADAFNVVLLG